MNKAELIEALSAHYDGSKTEAAKALNAVVQTITYKTAAGEKVSITGFGVFEKVHRSARMVRNPRTGERKKAKATAVPRFRAGTDLKAYVSGAKKVPRTAVKKATPARRPPPRPLRRRRPPPRPRPRRWPPQEGDPREDHDRGEDHRGQEGQPRPRRPRKTSGRRRPTAAKKTTARKTPAKKTT